MTPEEIATFVESLTEMTHTVAKITLCFEMIEHDKKSGRKLSQALSNVDDMRQQIAEGLIELRRQTNKVLPSEEELKKGDREFKRLVKALRGG